MQLLVASSPAWIELALAKFDLVLVDHAHCEKKAAANALSLLQAYPDVAGLPALMARLAREESAHLARVLQLMEARGLQLGRDGGDPYAQALLSKVRHGLAERRLDRFLVAGMIEARSHERLQLLSDGLTDPSLKRFYAELAVSEDGHTTLFERLAASVESQEVVDARLHELLVMEAEVVKMLPLRAAIH
jgi:tRNA 2-(methylsulfanyl)-N6-isopentenyladenosine37 hydroxylase